MSDPASSPPAPAAAELSGFEARHQTAQAQLKTQLLIDRTGKVLERLAAALYGALLGVPVFVAKSGFQHGGDAGPAGREGRRFRLETKRYAETTQLSERELLGEIDHALGRDRALEAWVLVATRHIDEQLAQSLIQKGESLGVPVLLVAWEEAGLTSLAALCASNPAIVEDLLSAEASAAAQILAEISEPAISALRRDMASWNLGFDAVRAASHAYIEGVWAEPRIAQSQFGQDVAVGARRHRVVRRRAHATFDFWLSSAEVDAPLVAVGSEGVGKTWSVIDWLHQGQVADTIILSMPATSVPALGATGERAVARLMAERLYDLTGVRSVDHWSGRLDNLIKRPSEEGVAFTLFFDGVNEAPSVPWLPLLKALQGLVFAGRVRVIVSSRETYFREKLGSLRSLIVRPHLAEIDAYDLDPGGEFDMMLAQEGLERADLDPDLIELARNPRLFGLAVGLRARLAGKGQVTVHRLLWEYGRDTFGVRAGRSFSEAEWHQWLAQVATQWRSGASPRDMRALGETVARPDLGPADVQARLSDIIDGRFFAGGPSDMTLSPAIVAHALGAGLIDHLVRSRPDDPDRLQEELARWLEPVSGLDQRAELLRAAVSIGIERDEPASPAVLGVLVTAWLQSQNLDERHLVEVSRIAHELVTPLLDAVERSIGPAQRAARLAAVNAICAVSREDLNALGLIVQRGVDWFRYLAFRPISIGDADADAIERTRMRFRGLIGTDVEGPITVLAANIVFGNRTYWGAAMLLPALLEGFPLATATQLFEAAALNLAIAGRNEAWDGLNWLCLLNEVDPVATREALRAASAAVRARVPEQGVDRRLSARVAALLLRLTGFEADEIAASEIEPRFDGGITYEADYLPDPGSSFLPLERRHASAVLDNPDIPSGSKVQRAADLFFDPTFELPAGFVADCRQALDNLDPTVLGRGRSYSIADHRFEIWQPAVARVDPERLGEFRRRWLGSLATATPVQRRSAAVHVVEPYVLADDRSAAAAAALRLSSQEPDPIEEAFVSARFLLLELRGLSAFDKACRVMDANLAWVSVELAELFGSMDQGDSERLLDRYGEGTDEQRHTLLYILSVGSSPFSDRAWSWVLDLAERGTGDLQGFAFEVLAKQDATSLGAWLDERGWSWAPDQHVWCNHWGSVAIAAATSGSAFEVVAPRLAPALLLAAVRERGSDHADLRCAAELLDIVLRRSMPVPDPGANLTVDMTRERAGPTEFSTTLRDVSTEGVETEEGVRPVDDRARQEWARRTQEAAHARIRLAQRQGAELYLASIRPDDLRDAIRHAPDFIELWLEGLAEGTPLFRDRVHLAEGLYLGLCEALLAESPMRGVELWRALRTTLSARYIGKGGIDELLHIAFRVPRSPEVERHLVSLRELTNCSTDQSVSDLVYAAEHNSRPDWVDEWWQSDAASPFAWQQRRAITIAGFRTNSELSIDEAWPAGPQWTSFDTLRTSMARQRWRDACARYWWRAFVSATDPVSAYANWVLYRGVADDREDAPMGEDEPDPSTDLGQLKAMHVDLNAQDLRRRRDKVAEKRKTRFLGKQVVQAFGPWPG